MLIQSRPLRLAAVVLTGLLAGCYADRPHEYAHERPDVRDTSPDDKGLQSKDVLEASDKVCMYLLQLPEFNQPTRQKIVVSNVENRTYNPNFNYDIFLQRLRANIGKYGRDRIMLIENKARVQHLRSDEIEGPTDDFGQGDGSQPIPPQSQNPDYSLYLVVSELPNQGNRYYLFNFDITNLHTREQIPLDPYEVKINN